MEIAEITNMCMIEDIENGTVLVQNRKKGSWTGIAFPGGHVEQGESIVDSVIREVKEETNLDIFNLKICGVKDWYDKISNNRYIVFLFKAEATPGDLLKNGDEGDVYWVKKDSLYSLELAHGFDKMLDVMFNDSLNEYFICNTTDSKAWTHEVK